MHGQTHKALSYCHVDSPGTHSKRPTVYSVGTNLHLGSNCEPSRHINLRFAIFIGVFLFGICCKLNYAPSCVLFFFVI